MKLNHLNLTVTNVAEARMPFYRNILSCGTREETTVSRF